MLVRVKFVWAYKLVEEAGGHAKMGVREREREIYSNWHAKLGSPLLSDTLGPLPQVVFGAFVQELEVMPRLSHLPKGVGATLRPNQGSSLGDSVPAGAMEPGRTSAKASFQGSGSIPLVLQRVLLAEDGDMKDPFAVLVLAVHAVMLETGFVPFDAERSSILEGSGLTKGWSSQGRAILHYTVPEMAKEVEISDVVLRCQGVSDSVVVYGTLSCVKGAEVYRLCLQAGKLLSTMQGSTEKADTREVKSNVALADLIPFFTDVYQLWKQVKDTLSIPLLTSLCETAGLPIPASLPLLPTEMKIKILQYLSPLDLARVGCVCSELRHLAANEELWKQRFKEWFGGSGQRAPSGGGLSWKEAFHQRYVERKRRRMPERKERLFEAFPSFGFPPCLGGSSFGMTGGDYDRFPVLGTGGGSRGGFGFVHGRIGGAGNGSRYEFGGFKGAGVGGRIDTDYFSGIESLNSDPRRGLGGWF